jgi:hypothetical protein
MPFTANEFHDLIRLVESHPEWRVELRRLVLTDEPLALPEQVGVLTEQMTAPLQVLLRLTGVLYDGRESQSIAISPLHSSEYIVYTHYNRRALQSIPTISWGRGARSHDSGFARVVYTPAISCRRRSLSTSASLVKLALTGTR